MSTSGRYPLASVARDVCYLQDSHITANQYAFVPILISPTTTIIGSSMLHPSLMGHQDQSVNRVLCVFRCSNSKCGVRRHRLSGRNGRGLTVSPRVAIEWWQMSDISETHPSRWFGRFSSDEGQSPLQSRQSGSRGAGAPEERME
jgi:hypothetical protein